MRFDLNTSQRSLVLYDISIKLFIRGGYMLGGGVYRRVCVCYIINMQSNCRNEILRSTTSLIDGPKQIKDLTQVSTSKNQKPIITGDEK